MEQLLFYHYLNFQRKQFAALGKRLNRIPFHIRLLFLAVVISMAIGLCSLFSDLNMWVSGPAVISEVVFALLFYVSIENYCIHNSRKQMERYWEYCIQLKDVLTDVGVCSRSDIEEIKERLEKQIQSMLDKRQAANAFLLKLVEIIAIPVILSIITTTIDRKDNIGEVLAVITIVMLAAGMLLAALLFISSLIRFPKQQKIEQMSEFCDDLQGILDLDHFGIHAADEECAAK